jgi:hypothetical protein
VLLDQIDFGIDVIGAVEEIAVQFLAQRYALRRGQVAIMLF